MYRTHPDLPDPAGALAARLMHQRIVVLGGELDEPAATRLCSTLLLLSAEDAHAEITVHLMSRGGAAAAGLASYDVIRHLPNPVRTVALGPVSGTATLLLAAGTPGRRRAMPHAQVRTDEAAANETARRLLADLTGQAPVTTDRWLAAGEALDAGIVDEVEQLTEPKGASVR